MKRNWNTLFRKARLAVNNGYSPVSAPQISSLKALKSFLDLVHIKHCLAKPFFEQDDYPLVESRELLPSFESDAFEHKNLPGFSLVAFNRPLNYFQEVFQYDVLHTLIDQGEAFHGIACPLERTVISQNRQTIINRLPKQLQDDFRAAFQQRDVSDIEHYEDLLPFLLEMDRAHVLALDGFGSYYHAGVYASFPSDLDSELKRFGLRIGKFAVGDNVKYELNRSFVYNFFMELYGFPVVSERRTSAALFARRLFKMGEEFLIRVLGQSDRTITTLHSHPSAKAYPRVEKLALVAVDPDQKDAMDQLKKGGYFLDARKRVVILRIRYRQHKFNPDNVRQDRALSVEGQEVIHPVTGKALTNLNIIKDTTNMFLRLNDIVRGEYEGRIIYKRYEVVENTETDDKRLKFLYSWLSKHQRRIIGYSDEFYSKVVLVLDTYLLNPDSYEIFQDMYELYQEVWAKYSYIQQARKVKILEDLVEGKRKGEQLSFLVRLEGAVGLLHDLKFEIVNYFEELVSSIITNGERLLNTRYLITHYVEKKDEDLSPYGREVKKQYQKLVALVDEFVAIRKSRSELAEQLLQQSA
ncbi:MAG: hypothetical protein D6E12_01755 [Desulfovibrio sp.]|nr:MAG: hypothetical protein D6E12_01755 [Desulfovibrio sp.]